VASLAWDEGLFSALDVTSTFVEVLGKRRSQFRSMPVRCWRCWCFRWSPSSTT